MGQENCDRSLANLSSGDTEDQVPQLVGVGDNLVVVHPKKRESRRQRGAFVAIDKGMVLGGVEEIGRCHLEDRRMKVLAVESSLGCRKGRPQKIQVEQPTLSAIAAILIRM